MAKKKYIETPEELLKLFCKYKMWTKSNPFKIPDWVGGTVKEMIRQKERPLTMSGFENYCFENGVIADLGDYFENRKGKYKSYSAICRACKTSIKADQIEGGMSGIYSTSITQRLNGLTEKSESTSNANPTDLVIKVVYEDRKPRTNETEVVNHGEP